MSEEEQRQTWRAVTASEVYEFPVVCRDGKWAASTIRWIQEAHKASPQAAVAYIAALWNLTVTEIRGPGELTTAEQVAAETARCAAICRQAGHMGDETRTPAQVGRECAQAILR